MNKKIILLMSIIMIVLFSTQVFAYETKGQIPDGALAQKGDIYDLKILSVEATKYDDENDKADCKIKITTNYKSENGSRALGILVSVPLDDKSKYPRYISELYESNKTIGTSVVLSKEDGKTFLYSPGNQTNEFNLYISDKKLKLCNSDTLDIYIFRPYYVLFGTQNNVIVYTDEGVDENHSRPRVQKYGYDLDTYSHSLYDLKKKNNFGAYSPVIESYYYNVDYAYGVPVLEKSAEAEATGDGELKNVLTKRAEDTGDPNTEPEETTKKETENVEKTEKVVVELNNLKINKIINKETNEELVYDTENDRYYFVSDNLKADVYLDSAYNQNKEICYLFTDLSSLNQENINSFVIKYLEGENVTDLPNVNCTDNVNSGKISLKNISENNYLLVLQRKDLTNLLVSKTRIVKISKKSYLEFIRFEINKKIANFFCPTCNYPKFNFDLAEDEEITIPEVSVEANDINPNQTNPNNDDSAEDLELKDQTEDSANTCSITKQKTLNEYITCLKNNFTIIGLNTTVSATPKTSAKTVVNIIDGKYNESNTACLNKQYNKYIFKIAKTFNFTLEETAMFWAKISAETGCDSQNKGAATCGDDCQSLGLGQINVSAWRGNTTYNALKSGFSNIDLSGISNDAYGGNNKIIDSQQEVTALLDAIEAQNDISASLIMAAAIQKTYLTNVITAPNVNINSIKEYDHNQSINLMFMTAYLYSAPSGIDRFLRVGLSENHKTTYESELLTNCGNYCALRKQSVYYSLHKIAYYLRFKKYYYNAENNGFNQALKENNIIGNNTEQTSTDQNNTNETNTTEANTNETSTNQDNTDQGSTEQGSTDQEIPVNLPYVMFNSTKLYIQPSGSNSNINSEEPYNDSLFNWIDASNYCDDLNTHGYSDWYLPSKEQLEAMWNTCGNDTKTNRCMNDAIKETYANFLNIEGFIYWSNTEYQSQTAYGINMLNGEINSYYKEGTRFVRCVRDE